MFVHIAQPFNKQCWTHLRIVFKMWRFLGFDALLNFGSSGILVVSRWATKFWRSFGQFYLDANPIVGETQDQNGSIERTSD